VIQRIRQGLAEELNSLKSNQSDMASVKLVVPCIMPHLGYPISRFSFSKTCTVQRSGIKGSKRGWPGGQVQAAGLAKTEPEIAGHPLLLKIEPSRGVQDRVHCSLTVVDLADGAVSLRVVRIHALFVYARLISQSKGFILYRAWC
jgi:hypothetical protein